MVASRTTAYKLCTPSRTVASSSVEYVYGGLCDSCTAIRTPFCYILANLNVDPFTVTNKGGPKREYTGKSQCLFRVCSFSLLRTNSA